MAKGGITTIPRITVVTYDTKANFPANPKKYDLGYATDESILYYYDGTSWVAISSASATSGGSYTGNDTQNQARPHGLGAIPKLVKITYGGGTFILMADIFEDSPTLISCIQGSNTSFAAKVTTVTAMDSTNFYVGGATGSPYEMNNSGYTYDWIAIG